MGGDGSGEDVTIEMTRGKVCKAQSEASSLEHLVVPERSQDAPSAI